LLCNLCNPCAIVLQSLAITAELLRYLIAITAQLLRYLIAITVIAAQSFLITTQALSHLIEIVSTSFR
jgi:hypothetical protein